MAKEDFDLFWNTHLHTAESNDQSAERNVLYWHAVKEETTNFPWTRREGTPRQHALTAVARDIMTQVRVATRKMTLSVTVLKNVSPCADCAEELLKAVALSREKKVKLDVTIAFVSLHKIRRPSCGQRGHSCAADVLVNQSNDHSLALRTLSEEGVKVMAFNPALWQFLHAFSGMGLPSGLPNAFLSGKYNGAVCPARMTEDSLMAVELRAILTGVHITSGGLSPDADSYTVQWKAPKLVAKKVAEYRIIYKKVALKNKDSDERLWKVQQTLSSAPTRVSVAGEMTSYRLTELERDAHYEMTLEAVLAGAVVSSAKRIFKTDDKVAIPALASAKKSLARSNSARTPSTLSLRSASDGVASNAPSPDGSPRKTLIRSNSRLSSTSSGPRSPLPDGSASPTPSPRKSHLVRSNSAASSASSTARRQLHGQFK